MEEGTATNSQPRRDLYLDLSTTPSATARSRAQSFSQALPSLRISTSPPSLSPPPISSPGRVSNSVNKARGELRKLLAHLLSRLKARPQAPSVYDELGADSAKKDSHGLEAVVESVRSAVRFRNAKELSDAHAADRFGEEDSTVENEQGFSTDVTYNYMVQLREVLILSNGQGWQIFQDMDAEATVFSRQEISSLRRPRRNSPQFGQRSRSPSFSLSSEPPDLLLECINILASVISEEGRFRMSSARIFRPPYGLQAVSLDIAQILIKTHRHDAKILSQIGFAVMPAFQSFNSVLHSRLLSFFEDGILRGMLEDLNSWQGLDILETKEVNVEHTNENKHPVVAIQVDEATDDFPQAERQQGWLQWSSASTPTASTFLSAVAPSQPLAIYHLSSLIPPLLAAILEAFDPFEDDVKDITRLHRFHTLLRTIVSMKYDAYLDVLEVIAYNGIQTRRKALAVLSTFWPKALGHVVIGKSLPIISYADALPRIQVARQARDLPYAHEFMPWRFFSQAGSLWLDYGVLRNCCQSCSSPIAGFGLLCPFCGVCVHLNCYDAPDGTFHGQYLSPSEIDHQQYFLSFCNILPPRRDIEPDIIKNAGHGFRLTNLFTLALCLICHKPLWGHVRQALKCGTCHQSVHPSCMANMDTLPLCDEFSLSSKHVVIDWVILRQTFVDYYRQLLLPENELSKKTYEEVSIFYSILWIQLRIFDNGVSYKSIIVNQKNPRTALAKENSVDEFELQYFVRLYEAYMTSGRLIISAALQEYYDFNPRALPSEHSILFDFPLLTSITSIIKTSSSVQFAPFSSTSPPSPSALLHVTDQDVAEPPDVPSHPYELVALSRMRNALGHEFQVYSDCAARYILSHIRQLGFFDRADLKDNLFENLALSEVFCSFPLPSGLDLSTSVETLVVAIEACLRDIDVTVNEYGFLLLARRFLPIGAASEYALTRLTKIILSWIFAEDDRLIIIARDHIAYNLNLPGVRTGSDSSPWPFGPAGRQTTLTAINSGGEYVLCRKQLLIRHAIPWLASVHELDAAVYTSCLYDHCVEVAEASETHLIPGPLFNADFNLNLETMTCGDVILRSLIKLAQANVTFSSFESILIKWFDFVTPPGALLRSLMFKSLPRLFNRETDSSRRTSTINEAIISLPEPIYTDPWEIFIKIATQSLNGLQRSLLWLCVMAHSAVDIPVKVLKHLFGLARDFHAPFITMVSLLESTMTSTWIKTFGSEGLDVVMIQTNVTWAEDLLFRMQSEDESEEILDFLRYSLVTCLLVYGCDRQVIVSLGLISPEELRYIPQRRRITTRSSAAPAVLEIDPQLVTILSRYVTDGPEHVCAIVAKFLSTLVSESVLLESHEIDHFILINGGALAQCAWRFYDVDSQEISHIRTSLLLRLLVVDSQPFDQLLRNFLRPDGKWQVRFQAVTRLFRILLDVNSPSFGVQDRQWKTSVTDVIKHFFCALWADDREEIRLAVDTWARSLLPAHLQVIGSCWDEYMIKAPVLDRAKLASFLVQFHPHFPSWQVLSWETIVECLLEDDFVQSNGADDDNHATAAHLSAYGYSSSTAEQERHSPPNDSDTITLRVSLLILSLQMIANKIEVDLVNLLKIKLILAKVFGYNSTNLKPVASGETFYVQFDELHEIHAISFPCINPLLRVLDAPHKLAISPSSMGVTWNELPVLGLVGDVFVDLVVKLWDNVNNVEALPYLVLRGLLESLILIIVKHELTGPSLKHLDELMCRAVKTVTDLVVLDTSYDIRHLCLAVILAFMQGYPELALKILGHQVLVLTRLVSSLRFNPEDSLVLQAREFLETAFVQYELSGLFWLLSKQGQMSDDIFVMIRQVVNGTNTQTSIPGETLRDSIVRDTLSKVAANANDRAIPDVLYNLEKYVAVCHHQSYPTSLVQHIGLRLTAIARHTADSAGSTTNRTTLGFDPNPLLLMSATIVQHNKSQSSELLLHTETLLRAALVRFDVYLDTLKRLLYVTSTMYRRSKTTDINGADIPTNHMAIGVLDILSDSLKGKVHPLPSTLTAMLEVVMSLHDDQNAYLPTPTVLRAGMDAISCLSYSLYRETHGQAEFTACLTVARLVLHASIYDDTFLVQSLTNDSRGLAPVRVWNLVALAALRSPSSDGAQKLLVLLHSFVIVYVSSLRIQPAGVLTESAAPGVNHAFASVKLWMLIARKTCLQEQGTQGSDGAERMVWNELWPPFERLLVQSFADSPNGELPPLLTFVWGCVSDLMLFVRQARSVVAMDTASHMSILNKLRTSSRGEVTGGKFTRAQHSISVPPVDISFERLVNQVSSDVLAAEKLHSIEIYRQSGFDRRRDHGEKGRVGTRELRTTA